MADGAQDDGAYGRSARPAGHVAVAVGTTAWAESPLPDERPTHGANEPRVSERIEAGAADAGLHQEELVTYSLSGTPEAERGGPHGPPTGRKRPAGSLTLSGHSFLRRTTSRRSRRRRDVAPSTPYRMAASTTR